MKFRFGTKTKEDEEILVKVVADPNVDETKWLPAMEVLGNKEIAPPKPDCPVAPEPKRSKFRAVGSFFGTAMTAILLVVGQVFMVSAMAVATGKVASDWFGQSFDRVMYHSGPQDTFLGIFIFAALPIFWTAWFLRERRFLKYISFCTLGFLVAYLVGGALLPLSGTMQVAVSATTLLLLAIFHLSGSFFSSFRAYWPRTFSVSKWLLIFYIPAIAIFMYEWTDMSRLENESVFISVFLIAAFSFWPAFRTGRSSGTRNYGSALGLAAIGQMPLLFCSLIYCLANAIMLVSFHTLGGEALSDFFAVMAGGMFPPDFDLASTSAAEIMFKFVSSLIVFGSLCASVCGGSYLAVWVNSIAQRKRIDRSL